MIKTMTVRVPDKMRKELKELASEQGLTRNGLILQILHNWLKKQKKDIS